MREAGRNPALAQFIDVLQCKTYTGGGGSRVVSCGGTAYDYCVLNDNDGVGNHILLGVVLDRQPPVCQRDGSRQTPLEQLDVKITDKGVGLQGVTPPAANATSFDPSDEAAGFGRLVAGVS